MKAGDIVLIELLQADGQIKKRPALLLKQMPSYGDWLMCGISSQLHQYIVGFDEKLDLNHPDFKLSSLKTSSIVRLSFLSVVPSSQIPGSIGSISAVTHLKILERLSKYLLSN